MHRAWGKPDSSAIAYALARYAVGNFHGAALDAYAARITREEGIYTLRDIFQLDTDYLSPLVCDALGGAWVDFLVRRRGQEILPVVYQEPLEEEAEEKFARALGSSWEALERDWRSYLLAIADRRAQAAPPTRPEPFFHRGISFSHEISRPWGYGSDRALKQLGRIRDLGANAIAIVPYAGTRAPRELTIRIFTGERDDRVIRTIQAAQARGLRIMLKPQLWGRGYTGDITFDNDADFTRWFSLYRRWLLHFARLAQLYGVDLLVVGTELEGVTHREQEWARAHPRHSPHLFRPAHLRRPLGRELRAPALLGCARLPGPEHVLPAGRTGRDPQRRFATPPGVDGKVRSPGAELRQAGAVYRSRLSRPRHRRGRALERRQRPARRRTPTALLRHHL